VWKVFPTFALGNNVTNESHPCVCSTGYDVEVWDLDFKDRGWFSKMQTMLPKSLQNVTKKFFSGVHPRPQVQSERDSVE
jgi:hypothetical protein